TLQVADAGQHQAEVAAAEPDVRAQRGSGHVLDDPRSVEVRFEQIPGRADQVGILGSGHPLGQRGQRLVLARGAGVHSGELGEKSAVGKDLERVGLDVAERVVRLGCHVYTGHVESGEVVAHACAAGAAVDVEQLRPAQGATSVMCRTRRPRGWVSPMVQRIPVTYRGHSSSSSTPASTMPSTAALAEATGLSASRRRRSGGWYSTATLARASRGTLACRVITQAASLITWARRFRSRQCSRSFSDSICSPAGSATVHVRGSAWPAGRALAAAVA